MVTSGDAFLFCSYFVHSTMARLKRRNSTWGSRGRGDAGIASNIAT